jgi:hypothetical protein
MSLPIGKTEENPFELGDRGLSHQHIQFGSGTSIRCWCWKRWDGRIRQDGNLGRSEVLATAGLTQIFGATLNLTLRAPVWRDIVTGDEPPGTLSSPLTVSFGVTHVFGAHQRVRP